MAAGDAGIAVPALLKVAAFDQDSPWTAAPWRSEDILREIGPGQPVPP